MLTNKVLFQPGTPAGSTVTKYLHKHTQTHTRRERERDTNTQSSQKKINFSEGLVLANFKSLARLTERKFQSQWLGNLLAEPEARMRQNPLMGLLCPLISILLYMISALLQLSQTVFSLALSSSGTVTFQMRQNLWPISQICKLGLSTYQQQNTQCQNNRAESECIRISIKYQH